MSGYFDALMRSSGMDIGGRVAAMAPAGPVEPIVVETDAERSPAETPSRTAEPAPMPRQVAAPIPLSDSVEQPAPLASPTVGTTTPKASARFEGAEQVSRPRAAAEAAADSPPAPAPRSVETSKPVLAKAIVRAAMQWVAADTQNIRGIARVVPPEDPFRPAPGGDTGVVTTQVLREAGVDVDAPPTRAMPISTAAPDLPSRETAGEAPRALVAAPALPMRPARDIPARPPVPAASLTGDEVVEISIGAIHVRVDAPAAQVVTQPVAPPPAAAPRAAAAPPSRSALSRRALRRI